MRPVCAVHQRSRGLQEAIVDAGGRRCTSDPAAMRKAERMTGVRAGGPGAAPSKFMAMGSTVAVARDRGDQALIAEPRASADGWGLPNSRSSRSAR